MPVAIVIDTILCGREEFLNHEFKHCLKLAAANESESDVRRPRANIMSVNKEGKTKQKIGLRGESIAWLVLMTIINYDKSRILKLLDIFCNRNTSERMSFIVTIAIQFFESVYSLILQISMKLNM